MPRRSSGRALVGIAAALAAANVARSTVVPADAHLPFNVTLGVGALAGGLVAGMDRDELGTGEGWARRGLRWGGPVLLVVAGGAVVGGLLPVTAGFFEDPRGEIGLGELLLRVLVVIPVGTVLVEEIAFRGVLLGLARRLLSPFRAASLTAVLFGLWHVVPAWRADGALVAAGTFVATTAAGAGFGWLRTRSDSLLAPILAHVATNSGALLGAWVAVR